MKVKSMNSILSLFKIKHYIKNLVVFVPVLFSEYRYDYHYYGELIIVFSSFCLMASIVYLVNDIHDIREDVAHPLKRNRPIASGRVSLQLAKVLLVGLFTLSVGLSFFIKNSCAIILWFYFVLNLCYTFGLKNFKYIDLCCIATGFILRGLVGFYVLNSRPDWMILIMIFVTSIFFTASKRLLENHLLKNKQKSRISRQRLKPEIVERIICISGFLAIACYSCVAIKYSASRPYLYLTIIPFCLLICRLYCLVGKPQNHDDLMIFIEKDPFIFLNIGFFMAIIVIICV